MPDFALYLILLGLGLVAGFINTVAGGGSMLTVPGLILAGLSASVANAANRIPVVLQCISAAWSFHRRGQLNVGIALVPILVILIAAVVGAQLASVIPEAVFEPILIGAMLLVALYMLVAQSPKVEDEREPDATPDLRATLALLGVGLFGGMIQSGVGLLLVTALAGLMNYDLTRANAVKVVAVLVFNVFALVVFALNGLFTAEAIRFGLVTAIGSITGAQLGVSFALNKGQRALRIAAIAMAVVACVAVLIR